MVKPADVLIRKWLRNATGAKEDYVDGINNPEHDPIQAALDANDKRKANLLKSLEEGTWEKTMATLTQKDWQDKALAVGPDRFVQGVKANLDKATKFQSGFNAMLQAHQNMIRGMPNATEEERDARMLANRKGMSALKGKWR